MRKLALLAMLMSMLMTLAPSPAAAATESDPASPPESRVSTEAPDAQDVLDRVEAAALRAADAQESLTPPPVLPGAEIPSNPIEAIGPPPDTIPAGWEAGTEIAEQRTATTKAFTGRVPGEIETQVFPDPVHFKEGERWLPIDSSLKASDGDSRSAKANDFDLELADSADSLTLAKLTFDSAHSVAFGMDKAARVKGTAGKKSVTYPKVQKSTDVRLTSTNAGVKEELILASPDAPTRFVFPLTLKGLTASIDEFGDVVYKDSTGKEWARTPHGYMFDSKVDPLSDEPAMSNGVTYALIAHGKGTALEVTLDQQWMASPDRVWPLTVDPELRTSWADDTYVMSGFSNDYSSDAELKVGTFNGGANKARSFMHFNTGNLPGTVTHAELEMREMHSFNCAVGPSPVYRATQGWVGSTTRTYPGLTYEPASQATGGWRAGDSCHGRKAWWIVTPTVQHWQNIGETMGSFVATASNESDSHQWKKYRSFQAGDGPLLKIWTNSRPYTPVELDPGYAQHRLGPSIALSAKHNDPEGDPATLAFGLWSYPAKQLVWAQWSPWVNSGQRVSVNASMPDGWYYFRVAAYDGQQASDFSWEDHLVFIDTVPPNKPTELTPGPNSTVGTTFTASARYTEPYGWPGELLFWVHNEANTAYVIHAWSPTVAYGAVGSAQLNLPVGKYNLYVYGYDIGQLSTPTGPHPITVAAAPGAPAGLNASAAPTAALVKWTEGPSNNSPITKYDFIAYNSTNPQAAPVQRACLTACSPTNGFLVDGLTPGNTYTIRATATNSYGTSSLSTASNSVTAQSWSGYAVTATTPARGDTSVRVDWTAQTLTLKYVVKAYEGTRPANGIAVGTPVSQVEALGGVTTANVGAPNSTPLMNGTPHYFTVTPYFLGILAGPESEASNDVVPAGAPFPPVDVIAVPGDEEASVLWNPPPVQSDDTPGDNGSPITEYEVVVYPRGELDPIKTVQVQPTSTSTAVTGLVNGTAYDFDVHAKNDAKPRPGLPGTSNATKPAGKPKAPGAVAGLTLGAETARVTWSTPVSDNGARITAYRIDASPQCPACSGLEVGGKDRSSVVNGLEPNTSYSFQVQSINRKGSSPWSTPSLPVTTPSDPALSPSNDAPRSPINVSQTKQNVFYHAPETKQTPAEGIAEVAWEAPPVGPAATSYVVVATAGSSEVQSDPVTGLSVELRGLDTDLSYSFAVVARNVEGESSPAHTGSIKSILGQMDEIMTQSVPNWRVTWAANGPHPETIPVGPQEDPGFMWDTDGCSGPTFFDLRDSCYRHDFGYHNYGHRLGLATSESFRQEVNDQFLEDMYYQCDVEHTVGESPCMGVAAATWYVVEAAEATFYDG